MSFVKTIIVVDQSIDVHDHGKIIDLLLNRVDLKRDLFYSEGILDVLNHASDRALYGSKLGIDATDKIEGEEGFDSEPDPTVTGVLPTPKAILENFTELISCKIIEREDRQRVAFATLDKKCPHQGRGVIEKFMSNREYSSITVLIILEGHEDVNDISTVLWKLLNNIDPKRDIHYFENRLAIDVTRKTGEQGFLQDWPDEIKMSDEIKKKVNEKWKKLF